LENTGLECTRFTVTSVLRTEESIRRLQRRNRNSVRNSSHLHGTTIDMSYKTFYSSRPLSEGEVHYLGQMLMRTLWEIRREKKVLGHLRGMANLFACSESLDYG